MTVADDRYAAIASDLADELGAVSGSMFGMPSLKTSSGKAFAGRAGDAMVFKLTGDAHGRALALRGAQAFDPMGGRPMREWVEVPLDHADQWPVLARDAARYVGGS